jgi:hypothetical protein
MKAIKFSQLIKPVSKMKATIKLEVPDLFTLRVSWTLTTMRISPRQNVWNS